MPLESQSHDGGFEIKKTCLILNQTGPVIFASSSRMTESEVHLLINDDGHPVRVRDHVPVLLQ